MRASYLFIWVIMSGFLFGCQQQEAADSPLSVQTDVQMSSQKDEIIDPIEAVGTEEVVKQEATEADDVVPQQVEAVAPAIEKPVDSLKAAAGEKPAQVDAKVEEVKTAVVEAEVPAVEVAKIDPVVAPVGDAIKGAKVSRKCGACHTFDQGGKNRVGPNLFGIVGRAMGSVDRFKYGPYLKAQNAAAVVWNEEKLRAWVLSSKDVAKAAGSQTKMPTQRIKGTKADDLIAYLKSLK